MTATFYVGDAITVMNRLPEKSVDLILTSPPFLALRSYLPADHPDKALEGGSQSTPGEFIDWLLDVVDACARVLAPHGSLVFELGDTYSGSGGAGGDYAADGVREGQPVFKQTSGWHRGTREGRAEGAAYRKEGTVAASVNSGNGWPLAKSLSLIPESFRWAMVYGHNPFTGRECATWRLRNVIRWVRPNPPVGALGDKFRPATSELMVFCKAKDRFFDLDAVREPAQSIRAGGPTGTHDRAQRETRIGRKLENTISHPAGAPPLDWWNIPLLDGEEPTKGGPKERVTHPEPNPNPKRKAERDLGVGGNGWIAEGDYHKRGGAPPLDWWNIPLLDGDEETRYGKKERPTNAEGRQRTGGAKFLATPGDGKSGGTETGTARFAVNINNPLGAPPLDWWNIPPGGYAGAHYAVWPPELLIKPIKAMTPERVCRVCGEPSRRIVGEAEYVTGNGLRHSGNEWTSGISEGKAAHSNKPDGNTTRVAPTLGFSDCGHDDWRPGLVLDPFGGSGTTALVATGHGRDCTLIDLDERNYELALDRVGPFILTMATDTPPA